MGYIVSGRGGTLGPAYIIQSPFGSYFPRLESCVLLIGLVDEPSGASN